MSKYIFKEEYTSLEQAVPHQPGWPFPPAATSPEGQRAHIAWGGDLGQIRMGDTEGFFDMYKMVSMHQPTAPTGNRRR